mmetsp:Transcript_66356/g.149050  ORF Transcript_66356/g.149050 Transcript_66356/m.149050 type:complete len:208 (-) Transcript_66356:644-1267(-)
MPPPLRAELRALRLPNVPGIEGAPKRDARGDGSTLSAGLVCNEVRDEQGCAGGELERPGEAEATARALDAAVLCSNPLAVCARSKDFAGRAFVLGASRKPLSNLLVAGHPPLLVRGDGRIATKDAQSAEGERDRRPALPVLEFDCTEEERRTPEAERQLPGRQRLLPLTAPPVPPSASSLLSSSSRRSCCWSCAEVVCIWLLIKENW